MEPNARRISEKAVSDYACAIGAKVFETSSKTGENVEELFETVARDYVQFEMQLEGLSRTTDNFIEQENKRKFCCF
ncbi:ras-related protein Rab-24-like protein [Dinothrombium tinctorium]|uniref:Ras-related protein Rab-24-like protein n=1 Tax=Dinothrombium tinctorium TaxID=1965070 RepID=A0A443R843_9ACAR|nr:ras-related protein Rab-24-like protein [Dinothrombium tinctorium]